MSDAEDRPPEPTLERVSPARQAFDRGDYATARRLNVGDDRDPDLAQKLGADRGALVTSLLCAVVIAGLFGYYVVAH